MDWVETSDFSQQTAQAWREQGITYAAIPSYHLDALQQTESGRAFLEALLPLRTFVDANDVPLVRVLSRVAGGGGNGCALWGCHPLDRHGCHPVKGGGWGSCPLRFYWRADAPPVANYSLFVHWVASGRDQPAGTARRQSIRAQPPHSNMDRPHRDLDESALDAAHAAADTPSGRYDISIGLYDFTTGQRLSVNGQDHHRLATVEVQ
ncbi:MAG UNVERIFIED_CONTAM: hypothetical protein LVT10_16140 [Anaerolineae bacterium]